MSMLSVLSHRTCLHYQALTWCRTLYIRQRINLINEVTRTYSSFEKGHRLSTVTDGQDGSHVKSDQRTSNLTNKRSDNYSGQSASKYDGKLSKYNHEHSYKRHKSSFGRKLFKDRDISDVERAAEMKDVEMLKDLPESERFGTGIGNLQEKGEAKQNKPRKQTVLPKNWSDTFGTMPVQEGESSMEKSAFTENEKYWDELETEDKTAKFYNHIRLARYNRRHIPNWYARKIMKLGKKGEIRKAIEVFDKWMIENDRVKPTAFEFSVLINLLADVGYTEKAFQLYYQMQRMKIYCPDVIYTSLFNACANSPWPEDGLKWANRLHKAMLVKDVNPTYITYLAMIKAFGRNGDINAAFRLADEAIELYCDDHLLSNLLNACISDKDAGFRHAVVVWRKFRKLGVQPCLRAYNLLLRAVRECGIGDPDLVNRLLDGKIQIDRNLGTNERYKALDSSSIDRESLSNDMPRMPKKYKQKEDNAVNERKAERKVRNRVKSFQEIDKLLAKYQLSEKENEINDPDFEDPQNEDHKSEEKESKDLQVRKEWWQLDVFENPVGTTAVSELEVASNEINLPNILNPDEDFSSVIQVSAVTSKEDRLAFLGGMDGFLKTLEKENIKPDIVTYTQLAQVVPEHLEDELIDEMWINGIKPDTDFYNLLIRKRVMVDKQRAWDLYERLRHEENQPNVKTFSCLALACTFRKDGLKLLDEMMAADIMPNLYTINCLLIASKFKFGYKKEILRKMQELGIKPNDHFIELIEKQISNAKQKLVQMERNNTHSDAKDQSIEMFRQKLQGFLDFYDKWAQHNILEEEPHPWKYFMEPEKEFNKQ